MKRQIAIFVLAALVGVSTPAFARDRDNEEIQCPDMPTSNDVDGSSSGGLTLQIGGTGLGGNRARLSSTHDVALRTGGLEYWGEIAKLSAICTANRKLYANDPQRQRDAFVAATDAMLARSNARADAGKVLASPADAPSARQLAMANTALEAAPKAAGCAGGNCAQPQLPEQAVKPNRPEAGDVAASGSEAAPAQANAGPAAPVGNPVPTAASVGDTSDSAEAGARSAASRPAAPGNCRTNSWGWSQCETALDASSSQNTTSHSTCFGNACTSGTTGTAVITNPGMCLSSIPIGTMWISPMCMSSGGGNMSTMVQWGWP